MAALMPLRPKLDHRTQGIWTILVLWNFAVVTAAAIPAPVNFHRSIAGKWRSSWMFESVVFMSLHFEAKKCHARQSLQPRENALQQRWQRQQTLALQVAPRCASEQHIDSPEQKGKATTSNLQRQELTLRYTSSHMARHLSAEKLLCCSLQCCKMKLQAALR